MYRLRYTTTWVRSASLRRFGTSIVFLAALAWLSELAWLRPLALPDEGRYVGVAWEMFWSGN